MLLPAASPFPTSHTPLAPASSPPPSPTDLTPKSIDIRKDLTKLDESQLIAEIARVQGALCEVKFAGEGKTPYVAALPRLNLPTHAGAAAEREKILWEESKRVAALLTSQDKPTAKTLLKQMQLMGASPSPQQLDTALALVQDLIQDALSAMSGREPLYCVCRRPYIDSLGSIRCQACHDWFHLTCLGFDDEESAIPSSFICPFCDGSFYLPDNALEEEMEPGPPAGRPIKPSNSRRGSRSSRGWTPPGIRAKVLDEERIKAASFTDLVHEFVRARHELHGINVELSLAVSKAAAAAETPMTSASSLVLDVDESVVVPEGQAPRGKALAREVKDLIKKFGLTYSDVGRQSKVGGGRHAVSELLNNRKLAASKVEALRRWLVQFRKVAPKLLKKSANKPPGKNEIPRDDRLIIALRKTMEKHNLSFSEVAQQSAIVGGRHVIGDLLNNKDVFQKKEKLQTMREWLAAFRKHTPPPIQWNQVLGIEPEAKPNSEESAPPSSRVTTPTPPAVVEEQAPGVPEGEPAGERKTDDVNQLKKEHEEGVVSEGLPEDGEHERSRAQDGADVTLEEVETGQEGSKEKQDFVEETPLETKVEGPHQTNEAVKEPTQQSKESVEGLAEETKETRTRKEEVKESIPVPRKKTKETVQAPAMKETVQKAKDVSQAESTDVEGNEVSNGAQEKELSVSPQGAQEDAEHSQMEVDSSMAYTGRRRRRSAAVLAAAAVKSFKPFKRRRVKSDGSAAENKADGSAVPAKKTPPVPANEETGIELPPELVVEPRKVRTRRNPAPAARRRLEKKPKPEKESDEKPEKKVKASSLGKKKAAGKPADKAKRRRGRPKKALSISPCYVGEALSALDSRGNWYGAQVTHVREGAARVHYIGWKKTFDEWIELDSGRLARPTDAVISSDLEKVSKSSARDQLKLEQGERNYSVCSTCRIGGHGVMLRCSTCPNSFHRRCLPFPVLKKHLNSSSWTCHKCSR